MRVEDLKVYHPMPSVAKRTRSYGKPLIRGRAHYTEDDAYTLCGRRIEADWQMGQGICLLCDRCLGKKVQIQREQRLACESAGEQREGG